MITYVCSYWLSPDAADSRVAELKRYFDLQCYLKKRMGSKQIILSNIDYPSAIDIKLPKKFTAKHAFFARYFGLKQLIEAGLSFPICLHDHDFFNAKDLPFDDDTILVGSLVDGYFSEQAVVYPNAAKQGLVDVTNLLWTLDWEGSLQHGYGTEKRHEGLFSTEQTFKNLMLQPFKDVPIRQGFNVKDQVSFDIMSHHSLDGATLAVSDSNKDIPAGSHAVHGHLNKGNLADMMLNWLAKNLS